MTVEFTTLSSLRSAVARWRQSNHSVALVPTMGALHAGHLQLVADAKKQARRVVVSIFVNPSQFGPNEDFDRYPRPLARDLSLLREAGADAVWLPGVTDMYPDGFSTSIHVRGLSDGLCAASRPGHFDGVATVVTKLLLQVAPDFAFFGEKDYQQLCIIRQLVADLNLPTAVVGVPIVREEDGLALSSRNQYLTAEQRLIAPKLYVELKRFAFRIIEEEGEISGLLADAAKNLINAGFSHVDYIELRSENGLLPLTRYQPIARLLAAAWLGKTRLIDNISF
jgi:pantoate--beta-alanine ligase